MSYDFGETSGLAEKFKSNLMHSKAAKVQRYNAEVEKIAKKRLTLVVLLVSLVVTITFIFATIVL
jgi:hypothetical protein